ncbi:hypothetical protein MNVI_32760 [Mycobacterium noviomagense]|uniref:Uncharacterized protein n=1 Tax=Mycobacterium noviomagense TaxID=459858 RepID=A0A7I7PH60_9MYCO|nr:hypothetical protein MNVI_32760 [Mycobacterium noviomagense]
MQGRVDGQHIDCARKRPDVRMKRHIEFLFDFGAQPVSVGVRCAALAIATKLAG